MSEPSAGDTPKLNKFRGKGARTDEPIQLWVGVRRKHLSLSLSSFSLLHASKTFRAVLLFAGCQHARLACPAEDLCHSAPCMCSPKGCVCLCDVTQNTSGPARERVKNTNALACYEDSLSLSWSESRWPKKL